MVKSKVNKENVQEIKSVEPWEQKVEEEHHIASMQTSAVSASASELQESKDEDKSVTIISNVEGDAQDCQD